MTKYPIKSICPKCKKKIWQNKVGKLIEPAVITQECQKQCEALLGLPLRKMWQLHTCEKPQVRITYYHGSSNLTSCSFSDLNKAAKWALGGDCACVYDLRTKSKNAMIARIGGDDPFVSGHTRVAKLFAKALKVIQQ